MNQKGISVLELLAASKIDVTQADELLGSLETVFSATRPKTQSIGTRPLRSTPEQVLELRNHDVDTAFLREMRDANQLTTNPEALIELKKEDA